MLSGRFTQHLGDRGGPSLSRFLHTVSSAAVTFCHCVEGFPTVLSPTPFARAMDNIDRFLPTCVCNSVEDYTLLQVPRVRAYHEGTLARHPQGKNLGGRRQYVTPHPLGSTTVASKFWRSIKRFGCLRTHCYLFHPRFAALIPLFPLVTLSMLSSRR